MTGFVELVTGFPVPSSTTTVTAGAIVDFVKAFDGCWRNASLTGALLTPGVMTNGALTAGGRLGLVANSV